MRVSVCHRPHVHEQIEALLGQLRSAVKKYDAKEELDECLIFVMDVSRRTDRASRADYCQQPPRRKPNMPELPRLAVWREAFRREDALLNCCESGTPCPSCEANAAGSMGALAMSPCLPISEHPDIPMVRTGTATSARARRLRFNFMRSLSSQVGKAAEHLLFRQNIPSPCVSFLTIRLKNRKVMVFSASNL